MVRMELAEAVPIPTDSVCFQSFTLVSRVGDSNPNNKYVLSESALYEPWILTQVSSN